MAQRSPFDKSEHRAGVPPLLPISRRQLGGTHASPSPVVSILVQDRRTGPPAWHRGGSTSRHGPATRLCLAGYPATGCRASAARLRLAHVMAHGPPASVHLSLVRLHHACAQQLVAAVLGRRVVPAAARDRRHLLRPSSRCLRWLQQRAGIVAIIELHRRASRHALSAQLPMAPGCRIARCGALARGAAPVGCGVVAAGPCPGRGGSAIAVLRSDHLHSRSARDRPGGQEQQSQSEGEEDVSPGARLPAGLFQLTTACRSIRDH